MVPAARILITFGVILLILGGLVLLAARIGLPLGRLPGDIRIERGNFSCVFPLATSILVSIVLTVLLNIIVRLLNR